MKPAISTTRDKSQQNTPEAFQIRDIREIRGGDLKTGS